MHDRLRLMRLTHLMLALSCSVWGCGSAQTSAHAAEPAAQVAKRAPSAVPVAHEVLAAGPLGPGDYPRDEKPFSYLTLSGLPGQGGRVREYKVHVPESYDAHQPMAVLFAFHGWHQNASAFAIEGAGWREKSDEAGFLLVIPNGVQADGVGGSFNAGTCCGAATEEHLDDVGFVRALFGEVQKHWSVDPKRVYAAGLSNGAFFSFRLACEASDMFVAVAALAGAIGTNVYAPNPRARVPSDFTECRPAQPVAVLAMHGTKDKLVPYIAMQPTIAKWAELDGCQARSETAQHPASADDVKCVSYPGCAGGVEVTGCTIEGGGHCWFGSPSCGLGANVAMALLGPNSPTFHATDVAWSFLSRFARAH